MRIEKPKRIAHTWVQHLDGPPAAVLPLLCPVREADWIKGWDPPLILSESGVAESDCVFVTLADPHNAIWYVTQHDAGRGFVEMIKITPGVTACRLKIELVETGRGTDATVTYMHTSLGPEGDAYVEGFTTQYYAGFMRDWEARLNHYLTTGERLDSPA